MSGTAKLVSNLVGTRLGDRYVLEEKIGAGGFAVVYRARDTRISKQVAVKVLDRAKVQNLRDIARFRNEAAIAAAIDDDHIIKITDYGEEGTVFYYVMELLRGHSLRSIITMHDRLHWQRACDIGEQVCLALELAHERGIIHRDVKPENIFVEFRRGAENIKLLDLGIAKVVQEWDGLVANLSNTGDFIGSPSYMAPEQARGTKYADFRVDLYALGVVLYELVTGAVPFRGESAWETMLLHVEQPPPPLARRAPDIECPPELEAVILRALAKDPAQRFQTATELREALVAIRTSRPALPWAPLCPPAAAPDSFPPRGQTKVAGAEALARTTPDDRQRPANLPQKTALAEVSPAHSSIPETAPARQFGTTPLAGASPQSSGSAPRSLDPALASRPLRWRTRLYLAYLTVAALVATCTTSTLATVTLKPQVLEPLQQRPRRVHILATDLPEEEPAPPPAPAPAPTPAPAPAPASPADTDSPFDRLLLAPPETSPPTSAPAPIVPEPAETPSIAKKKPAPEKPAPEKPVAEGSTPPKVQRRPTMAAIARQASVVIKENCLITAFSPLTEANYTVVFRVSPTSGVIESITPEGDVPPLKNPDCVKATAKRIIETFGPAGDLRPEYRHTYQVVR